MAEDLFDYDLLVIGSGPAGQRAAIQGAKLNKKVADRREKGRARRLQRQSRHNPVENPARGGP